MAKRSAKVYPAKQKATDRPKAPSRQNLLLMLTLLPTVAGFLLILAWAIDIAIWQPPDLQEYVAVFLILTGFALSNLVQKKWVLAAGWGLMSIADWLLLLQPNPTVKSVGIGMGVIAFLLLLVEFVRQFRVRA